MRKYNVIDLFCGAGGMSKGFEQSGRFKVVLGTDHDSAASGTFKLNHPNAGYIKANVCYLTSDDICEAANVKKGEIDIIIGGTPCQGFSTLGKRLVEDPRNILFCEFVRLVQEIKPPIFVLENVGGMKTMKNVEDDIVYDMVKMSFHKIGYEVKSYLLNAAHYGVPQERKRLLFIGCKYEGIQINEPPRSHYLQGECSVNAQGEKLKKSLTIMDAISDLPEIGQQEGAKVYKEPINEYQKNMRNWGANNEVRELSMHYCGSYSEKLSLIMKTIPSGSGKTIWQLIKESPQKVPKEAIPTSGFKNTYGRLEPDRPSMTITRNFSCVSSSRCVHPFQNRSLTPREAARIQSFKDDFIFVDRDIMEDEYIEKKSSKQDISFLASFAPDVPSVGSVYLYKSKANADLNSKAVHNVKNGKNGVNLLIGNAVPPMLAEAVAKTVASMLDVINPKKKSLKELVFTSDADNDCDREIQGSFNF